MVPDPGGPLDRNALSRLRREAGARSAHGRRWPAGGLAFYRAASPLRVWLFTSGETVVTLRLEDGTSKQYDVSAGTLIVTPRGVEHSHTPRTEVEGYQWCGVLRPGARRGHLRR